MHHLNELLKGEPSVHVFVHLPKDLLRSLLWRGLVLWHLEHRTNLVCQLASQLQKVFFPPVTCFLRRNFEGDFHYMDEDFPNIEEEFS